MIGGAEIGILGLPTPKFMCLAKHQSFFAILTCSLKDALPLGPAPRFLPGFGLLVRAQRP